MRFWPDWLGRWLPKRRRLVYAATARCQCGAGLAFDPHGPSGQPLGYWACSRVLLEQAPGEHCEPQYFAKRTILAENGADAHGQTTRR
ncbi:hypothetical protein BH10PLA2_BH10PLA2_09230 [soil metagenome]